MSHDKINILRFQIRVIHLFTIIFVLVFLSIRSLNGLLSVIVIVIMTSVWVAVTSNLVVRGCDFIKGAIADLRTEIFNFGFTKDTLEMISNCKCISSDLKVNTYIQVLLEGDL